ncbi:MAG: P1 family peptidase [Candidatus Eremiobacteraeota bacterium]|nr:P1 family peptidase [Candidatus Eremiobacteraeota bacterium]
MAALSLLCCLAASASPAGLRFGDYSSGPNDGITDVPGVRIAHLTKVEGSDVRTGATAIVANDDPWNNKVAAAAQAFNGNGEMTGTHWVNEAGYLESPVVLTDTLDIGRADDGVISWMMRRYPKIGVRDDVPLPVVAECDDQLLNDIRGRHVHADDITALLDRMRGGQFLRGSVGAGTGMRAFGFKAGIGSASRVLPKDLGGYTVGALVNDNTGSSRELLQIDGVHVGRALKGELLPVYPKRTGQLSLPTHGRQSDGSIIVIVATNAPLDHRQLIAITKRIELGMGRVGLTSQIGSGDLFLAFSTSYVYKRDARLNILPPQGRLVERDESMNAIYAATIEATENAIYDALFSARTMTGRGVTVYGLPVARVKELLHLQP